MIPIIIYLHIVILCAKCKVTISQTKIKTSCPTFTNIIKFLKAKYSESIEIGLYSCSRVYKTVVAVASRGFLYYVICICKKSPNRAVQHMHATVTVPSCCYLYQQFIFLGMHPVFYIILQEL